MMTFWKKNGTKQQFEYLLTYFDLNQIFNYIQT